MGFELFTKKKLTSKEPTVSTLKSGSLFINSACFREHFSGAKYVNLLYDKKTNTIGLKPVKTEETYSYSIRQGNNRQGAAVSALSFFKYFAIDFKDESKSYPATWNDKEKLIEVKLK